MYKALAAIPAELRKEIIRQAMAENGRRGGHSVTPARLAAVRANLVKARAKRWPAKPPGKPATGSTT